MIAKVSVGFIVCGVALISVSAFAQSGKPPCGAFQKLGDGKWNVVKAVKIENGNASVMLKPGTSIGPGTRVSGVDIYAALERGCLQAGNSPIGGRP
jgi:hypothetical protein